MEQTVKADEVSYRKYAKLLTRKKKGLTVCKGFFCRASNSYAYH